MLNAQYFMQLSFLNKCKKSLNLYANYGGNTVCAKGKNIKVCKIKINRVTTN